MTEQRQRADRASEETAQRRRRDDTSLDGSQRLKLAIPSEVQARLDAEGRTPRWAEKNSTRMYELTQKDDYDVVPDVAPIATRSLRDGSPIEMVLLSKPKDFIEQDRRKKESTRAEVEKAYFDGSTLGPNQYIAGSTELDHRGRKRDP